MRRALILALLAACSGGAKPAPHAPPPPPAPAPAKAVDFCEGLGAMYQSALGGFAEYTADEHDPPLLDGASKCYYLPADDGTSFGMAHPAELGCIFMESYDHAAVAAAYLEIANRTARCINFGDGTVPDDGRDEYSFSGDETQPKIIVEHETNGDDPKVIQRVYVNVALPEPASDDSSGDDDDDDDDY